MSTPYQVGSATLDITPPVGIKLAGFAALQDPSTSVELPLRAVAYSIVDAAGSEVLLITAELIGFYDKAPEFRKRISEATGVNPDYIVLNVTHTHAGPCFREMDAVKKGPLDMDYYRRLLDTVVDVAVQARANRQPSHIAVRTVEYPFGVSRRRPDGQGGVVWAPYPEGTVDSVVSIMDVRHAQSGDLSAVLFSYGCHPTSRATLDIGGDYVGFAYRELDKRKPGVTWGFFQGFAGDVKPGYALNADGSQFGHASSEQLQEQGEKWADLILNTLEGDQVEKVSGPLNVYFKTIPLALRRPGRELHEQFLNSDQEVSRRWAKAHPYQEDAVDPDPMDFEIQVMTLGNSVVWVFLAAEISAGYAQPLRERLGKQYKVVVPVGYSNRMIGYVPAASQIPEGGYEVYFATQHSNRPGFYTEEAEEQILSTVERLVLHQYVEK